MPRLQRRLQNVRTDEPSLQMWVPFARLSLLSRLWNVSLHGFGVHDTLVDAYGVRVTLEDAINVADAVFVKGFDGPFELR